VAVGEGGRWGYYTLCAVWVSWAVLAKWMGRRTMARRDYSAALLFQHTACTTLQFRRLRVRIMIVSAFLERALH
jgi:hypothetical protein